MHDKFFQTARLNMVRNQILPNNVKNKALIESFSSIQKRRSTRLNLHRFRNKNFKR